MSKFIVLPPETGVERTATEQLHKVLVATSSDKAVLETPKDWILFVKAEDVFGPQPKSTT